jgi:uncharacterized membrane protein (UPF0127 family)/Flp pilus assembly protein TadG
MHVSLINERTRQPVATEVEIAATRTSRRRGLLGRDSLAETSAMLIAPCSSIHTIGMRFPIDVVFVDRQGFALKIVRNLQPWRIALAAGSQAVIEMAAGSLEWGKVMPGDRLFLAPVSATEAAKEEAGFSSPRMRSLKNAPPVNGFVRRLRDTAGTSIVEAAIITPLLLLLTLSIVDFGALFYCYLALENGVSQATRFAVTGNLLDDPSNPGTNLSRDASIKLAMRQATPTLTLPDSAFTFSSMPPGGTAWGPGSGGPNALAKVSVSYTWTFFNPMLWAFFSGGQITLNVESAMKNEGAPPS